MKKFIALLLSFNLSANVNWSHESSCSIPNNEIQEVEEILSKMTLEQKVGQIIMPDLDAVTPLEAKVYQLGTILNGGGKFPNKEKYSSVSDWKSVSKAFYEASPIVDGKIVPILWGTDAVHGHNNVIGATIFPHNIGLGSTRNADLIRKIGDVVAKELLSTGIIWTFAPTIAVPQNDLWGRTYEGYSEDPELVSVFGEAMILGLQGTSAEFLDENHVLATAKHFLGDGGTKNGVDQGNAIISEQKLRDIHGLPYYKAIDACVQSVMASFNSWNGEKMHGNKDLLENVLRDQMGFNGLVVGDWNGHGQVPGCTKSDCPQSLNAGVDIFMVPDDWKELYTNTLNSVQNEEITISRLDDAVRRVLTVKYRLGLLSGRIPHDYEHNYIGNENHRKIARQAVRESIVLLKNNNQTLPIKSNKHILVVGSASQNISSQMGGWTITWQGRGNLNSDFPNTLSIYEAIEQKAKSINGSVEYSEDGTFKRKPDVVIFVYGEEPYAEGDGDRKNIFFMHHNKSFINSMQKINDQGIPSVSLFISGRPLVVNQELNLSDAFVQLWLPGTAVEGIGDVIFTNIYNKLEHDFVGKLSYSWPKLSTQADLNFRDNNYDPLFEYGYGLSYKDDIFIASLPEEDKSSKLDEITIFIGSAYPSYGETVSYFSTEKNERVYDGINSDIYTDKNSGFSITKFDFKKQDDAKLINFGSKDTSKTWFIGSGSSEDISYMKSGSVQLILRPKKISSERITLDFGCYKTQEQIKNSGSSVCYKSIDLTTMLKDNFDNNWKEVNIPIQCLMSSDFEASNLTLRSQLSTTGDWELELHSIKFINNQGYNSCSATISNYE